MENTPQNQSDHDLLVQLHTSAQLNFEQIRKDIKELKDGTADKITDLENRVDIVEKRADKFERKQSYSSGWFVGFGISIALILGLIIYIFQTESQSEQKTQSLIETHIQETMK
jgi:hypothetical protein